MPLEINSALKGNRPTLTVQSDYHLLNLTIGLNSYAVTSILLLLDQQ